jgi:hypothetical protein
LLEQGRPCLSPDSELNSRLGKALALENQPIHFCFQRSDHGGERAREAGMLLVITPSAKARGCAQAIQKVTSEETHVATTLSQAMAQLRAQEYVAVLIDQAFLETEPVESDMVLEHIGTAIPVHVNFAISGMDRVVRALRAALHRHKKGVLRLRQEIHQAIRNELKDTVTAILLSCEMALQVPNLPGAAEIKMRSVRSLAQEVRVKLDGA